MRTKTDKIPMSFIKALDLQANWSKNAILQMLGPEDFEEHPRIKLCNEYLKSVNLLPSETRKR